MGHGTSLCGARFLFIAFNLVDNGVSLFVKHSAKYFRYLKGRTLTRGKRNQQPPVF